MKTKNGISLIVLVLTVIVLSVLASAVIITLNNTNVIGEAKNATFKSDMAGFKEAYELYLTGKLLENHSYDKSTLDVTYGTATFKEIFGENVPEKYSDLQIAGGILSYPAKTTEEETVCANLNINTYIPSPEAWFTNCTLPTQAEMEAMGITSGGNTFDSNLSRAFDLAGKSCFDSTTGVLYSVAVPEGVTELVIPEKISGVAVTEIAGTLKESYGFYVVTFMPNSLKRVTVPENVTLCSGAFSTYDDYLNNKSIEFKVKNNGKVNLRGYATIVMTDSPVRLGNIYIDKSGYGWAGISNVTNVAEVTGDYERGISFGIFETSKGTNIYEFPKGLSVSSLSYLLDSSYHSDMPTSGTLKVTQSQFDYVKSNLTYTQVESTPKKFKVTKAYGYTFTDFYIEIW